MKEALDLKLSELLPKVCLELILTPKKGFYNTKKLNFIHSADLVFLPVQTDSRLYDVTTTTVPRSLISCKVYNNVFVPRHPKVKSNIVGNICYP